MRRTFLFTLAALSAAVLVLGACSSDTTTATDDATTSTAPGTVVGSAGTAGSSGSAGSGDGADASSDCVAVSSAAAPAIATRSFPDNADETWTVGGVAEGDDDRAIVEMVPGSAAVGYPRFRMVMACDAGEATLLATYALDGGAWVLLFTTDAAEDLTFDPELAE